MDPLLANRLVFILGFVNFAGLSAIFLSCRCMGARKPFSKLLSFRIFSRFYRYHCYFWLILWLSVITHLVIAIWVLGVPFS